MKYLYNPATDSFEALEPTMRDRFALGGRVNFDKGSPFVITDEVLEQIDNLIKDTNLNLKEIGSEIGYGTEKRGMTIDTPVMERYIEKYGRPSDARLQTKGVPLSSEKGLGKKIVKAYDKQIKNFGKPDISKIAREVYGPGVKDFDSARAQVRSVLGRFRNYKGKANVAIDKKDLTAEQIKSKARAKKLKLVDNTTIAKFMAGPKDSGFQYHHMDATKTSPVTLNNVVYLPNEVNNYIQSYEGPISQRKKEITKLNKNKPKGYKKQIDAKLNQIRNTIAKADMDLDKAGYSAYKGVIEVDTVDVNGKPIKIGGGSALRLGEGLAEELGLDPNKPLKQFSSEEKIKLTEAKKSLIKKSSINKPKATGLAKKGLKTILKQVPLVGSAIGLYDVGKAVKAGIRDPRDLYTAYEVSPEIAAKQKAIREDPTGKLLKEEIANLPEITTDDQVAGLLEESGSPYMQFLQDGGQLSFEEFQKMQSIPQSDRPVTGKLDLPEMDQTMMAAQGGRVGFSDGSPNPEVMAQIKELLSGLNNTEVMDNALKNNAPSLKESMFGKEGERSFLQRLYETYDPRAFPYYAAQFTKGVALAPEFAGRLTLAAPKALAELAQGKKGVGAEFAKNIDPKVTQKQVVERFGLQKIIDEMDKDVTGSQRTSGDLFKMVGESLGPATGVGYIASAGKAANQVRKQIQKYAGSAEAAKELERSVEEKASSLQMTRREFNTLLAGGGIVGLVKALGLDTIFPAAKQVAKQAAPIVTKGGTPKYFFDFVNLIKTKGDDITEKAATVERQKVYDYNGYTMYEDITTGKISIRKDTEGGATYSIGDGEYETVDGIIRKEEINYEPSETILNEKGKPVKVPDQYDEATVRPDEDGGEGDFEAGLDSIDDILDLLSKDGKTYSKDELIEMGIRPDVLTESSLKTKKAGGGIIKLAGDDSGPPPKSGPTPHGLPYVAKNVRPIKERK